MNIEINGSKHGNDGVHIYFGAPNNRDFYYTHSVTSLGDPNDSPGTHTMWSWINHLRDKNWFNEKLEESFRKEVEKYFD